MSTIKAGDLVMVVRPAPCWCMSSLIGLPFVVEGVTYRAARCVKCKVIFPAEERAIIRGPVVDGSEFWEPAFSRLIKIDPPALPETIEREQEAT